VKEDAFFSPTTYTIRNHFVVNSKVAAATVRQFKVRGYAYRYMHTHTHTHTHSNTRTHAHTHSNERTLTRACATFHTAHHKLQADRIASNQPVYPVQADRIVSKQPLMVEAANIVVKQVAEKIIALVMW